MDINESRRKMSLEEYINIKESAYTFAKCLEKESIIKYIKNMKIDNIEESLIYIYTLLFPNDIEIMDQLATTINPNKISENLNIPISIIQAKINEFSTYNIYRILGSNSVLRSLASQQSKFSTDEVNQILDTKLK